MVLFKDKIQVEISVEKRSVCMVRKYLMIWAGGDPASAEKEKIQVKDLLVLTLIKCFTIHNWNTVSSNNLEGS